MTDTSYHIAIWIGIGIGIGIGKIFSSVLGIESIGKMWYRSTFSIITCLQSRVCIIVSHATSSLTESVSLEGE